MSTADSPASDGSAFMAWFNESSRAGAGKEAGELAEAAWNACVQAAADAALNHKLWATDQTGAGFYGAVQMLRTDTPNTSGEGPNDGHRKQRKVN